jgi:ATP-dependent helicase HrpB
MSTRPLLPLPIDSHIAAILAAVERHGTVVVVAPPGTGKTTRVPPALLAAPWRREADEIIVLEPRRLAAKMTAERVAYERGEEVGATVGYRFRGESRGGNQTRLSFYTEGTLLRRCLRDHTLQGVAAVVLDEFHERHLQGDLALAYLKRLKGTTRPDLKLIVMSATLDAQSVATYLGNAPIIEVAATMHPVEIEYLARPMDRHLDVHVEQGVRTVLAKQRQGDVLVFLPGMSDIRRAESRLNGLPDVVVAPLHGSLSKDEQKRAVEPLAPGRGRKVILATNIAETSLTIPGVTAVVDSGLHRQGSFSFWSGMPLLATKPISRASATQRGGRAGRTAPGYCLRLFTKADFDGRALFDLPEVRRADLAQTVLELKAMGVDDLQAFPWFEIPEAGRLEASSETLWRLGAQTSPELDGAITDLGRQLAAAPTHPRLSRALWEGLRLGVEEDVARILALLENGDLINAPSSKIFDVSSLDESALQSFSAKREKQRLLDVARGEWGNTVKKLTDLSQPHRKRVARACLAGFPDRIALKRRGANGVELFLSSGGTARGSDQDLLAYEKLFAVIDAQEVKRVAPPTSTRPGQKPLAVKSIFNVTAAVPIEEDWLLDLEPTPLKDKVNLIWDKGKGRVFEASRLLCDQLVLSEELRPAPASAKAAYFLFVEGLGIRPQTLQGLPLAEQWAAVSQAIGGRTDLEQLDSVLGKLELLGNARLKSEPLSSLILTMAGDMSCLDDMKSVNWGERWLELLSPEELPRIHSLLPERLTLANGRKATVHYRLGHAPWVESRLQDFFGMRETPKIMGGRVPLTLHLLAPNKRAVQVTQDLTSFWDRTYAEVRRELFRRYPRHKWPEDPRALFKDEGD